MSKDLILKSTKAFHKLPVAHMQWFDTDASGEPCTGPCAKWHGYDRSVIFEFCGTPDEHGWIVPFGNLKDVRKFVEYYFDHTAVAPADDPRMKDILEADAKGLVDLRVLPYGVSMEMSSLFIWEQVNPYIQKVTNGRCWVSRVECREHDSNSAFLEIPEHLGRKKIVLNESEMLQMRKIWPVCSPADVLHKYSVISLFPDKKL